MKVTFNRTKFQQWLYRLENASEEFFRDAKVTAKSHQQAIMDATMCDEGLIRNTLMSTLVGMSDPKLFPHRLINRLCINTLRCVQVEHVPVLIKEEFPAVMMGVCGSLDMSRTDAVFRSLVEDDPTLLPPRFTGVFIGLPRLWMRDYLTSPVNEVASVVNASYMTNLWMHDLIKTPPSVAEIKSDNLGGMIEGAHAIAAEFFRLLSDWGIDCDTEEARISRENYPQGWASFPAQQAMEPREVFMGDFRKIDERAIGKR